MKEDFVTYGLAVKLNEKGFPIEKSNLQDSSILLYNLLHVKKINSQNEAYRLPSIYQVLKWLREEKNIDVEVHAVVGILGCKVYIPYISTYTEFALESSPDIVRYRQKKFNTTIPLKHEIIPAHKHFEEWEEAALDAIEYVIDNLIV